MTEVEHLLTCLAEECAEVGKQACKALRFGLERYEPGREYTNAERIMAELDDVMAIVEMLIREGALRETSFAESHARILQKKKRVLELMEVTR